MTHNQGKILLFAIQTITGFREETDTKELKSWAINQGLIINERTIRPSFGQPAYTCEILKDEVVLHKSSNFSQEGAFLHCIGEYCKDRLVEKFMNS